MHKFIAGIMLFLGFVTGVFLLFLIISALSWKIYTLIYSSYTLGLLFPYPKYHSIVVFLVISFSLLMFVVVRIIARLQKH